MHSALQQKCVCRWVKFVAKHLLGPGYVLLYNTMWGVLGSQRAVYVTFGPMALAIGLLKAILLYQYFRDRD